MAATASLVVATTGNPAATTALAVATSQAFGSRRGSPGRCSDAQQVALALEVCQVTSSASTTPGYGRLPLPHGMPATVAPEFVDRTSEREVLDRLLANVREGQSAVLVIRGEAGIGKTALLRYAARQASGFRVAQVTGVEAEMELPFAGIHQLCAPVLDQLDALPQPQQDALYVALGLCIR